MALHLKHDLFIADGTWTSPAAFWSPAGTANACYPECIGAGGDGTTAVGAGGGGEYAAGEVTGLSPSTGYAVVVGTSGVGADGEDSTFNSTSIVAKGGKNGTNGGAGGTGGTGTTLRAGGAGTAGAGNTTGGAASGSTSAASGTTPGDPEGGFNSAANLGLARFYGGGGSSSGADKGEGSDGLVRVSYQVPATSGYSRCIGRTRGRTRADGTSFSITLPPGSGGRLVLKVSCDGTATVSATGWTALTQVSSGSAVVLACLHIASTGAETTTIDLSASEQVSWICERWISSTGGTPGAPEWTTATGSSTSADPPSHTPSGGSAAYVWQAIAAMDANTNAHFTAFPAGYGSADEIPAGTTGAAGLAQGEKFATAASDNPGAFTLGSEQWCAATLSIPPT